MKTDWLSHVPGQEVESTFLKNNVQEVNRVNVKLIKLESQDSLLYLFTYLLNKHRYGYLILCLLLYFLRQGNQLLHF